MDAGGSHDEGIARLDRWREATSAAAGPDGANLLARIRACLAADLDAPRALAAIDGWVAETLGTEGLADTSDPAAAATVHQLLDAALGLSL